MRLYSVEGKAINQTANGGGMGAKTGLYAVPVNAISEADGKNIPHIRSQRRSNNHQR